MKKLILSLLVAVGLIGSTAASVLTGSLTNGLVAYYGFNGNTLDLSGNGNDLVSPNGINYVAGVANRQAGVFDGSTTYSYISKALTTNNNYTWSLWFKATDVSQYQVIMDQGGALTGSSAVTPSLFLNDPNSSTGVGAYTYSIATGSQYTTSSTTLSSGTWYNVTWTSLNGTRSLYINGSLRGSSSGQSMTETWSNFYVGGTPQIAAYQPGGAGQFYKGLLSDVGIYNRALSSTEAADLYTQQSASNFSVIPEPSTYALFGIGAIGMLMVMRRKRTA